jgi:hypothetical protein
MPEAVVRLDGIFPQNIARSVAVVAGGGSVVAGLQPGVILGTHHVAVGTGRGIVGEVGISLGIDKGEPAEANEEAQSDSEKQSIAERRFHRSCYGRRESAPVWHGLFRKTKYTLGKREDVT